MVHNAQLTNFVTALMWVYTIMIFGYIIVMLPLPYNRPIVAVRNFLEQTVSPYLALFRRFIPPFGPLDLSPMVALLVLQFGRRILFDVTGI